MAGIDVFAKLTLRMKYPKSERLRAVLEKMVTLEEAEILLELPTPSEEIATKLNLDKETVDKKIRELYLKGVAIHTSEGYLLPPSCMNLRDNYVMATPGLPTEIYDLWLGFFEEEYYREVAEGLMRAEPKSVKVIPAWKAIKTSRNILPEQDMRQLIQQAERVAISHCPCRTNAKYCDGLTEVCLVVDGLIDERIERGMGREVSKEEAIEILGKAEEQGLIHTSVLPPFRYACSCCNCCCAIFQSLSKYGKLSQGVGKSSYRCVVNEELCDGCQLCIDQCCFEVVEMKNGKAFVDVEKCFGCGLCVVMCPVEGALRLELADCEIA